VPSSSIGQKGSASYGHLPESGNLHGGIEPSPHVPSPVMGQYGTMTPLQMPEAGTGHMGFEPSGQGCGVGVGPSVGHGGCGQTGTSPHSAQ